MSEVSNQVPCFVDTNIWLYAFIETSDPQKQGLASSVIQQENVVISTQVINEICINLLKKTSQTEVDIQTLIHAFYSRYTVIGLSRDIILEGSALRMQYSLSYWDSLIVASALHNECNILYSEDMQDGLKIGQNLTVVNPLK